MDVTLTRILVNASTLDGLMLLMAVVLVLVISRVMPSSLQQCKNICEKGNKPKQHKLTRKLSNVGLTTLVTEVPTNLSIPVSVLTVKGLLTKEDYVERLRRCLLRDAFFVRWRSVVRGDYQSGVYKFIQLHDYDVAHNVMEHTIVESETTMSYVESVLVNKPLDFDKPLWEMHVIHDPKGNPNITSIAWKVHHCLGDGASLATAMMRLSDQSEMIDAMQEKRAQAKENPTTKTFCELLFKTLSDTVTFLYICIWSLYVISRHMGALIVRREPPTIFKRPGGQYKRLSYIMLYSVKDIKAIGRRYQATVNDVMLNVVAGAMRKTMLTAGDPVPRLLKVRCAIPVDMRSSTEIIRYTSNRFSSLVIDLPVGIKDSVERLREVTRAMNEAKNSLEKYFVYWSSQLLSMLPAAVIRCIVHFFSNRLSVAVSNVRISTVELSLCKCQVTGFYGFVPPPPYVNLGLAILSVGDDLGLNVLVDPCIGIDAEQFLEFAKEEFAELLESVTGDEATSSEKKKAK